MKIKKMDVSGGLHGYMHRKHSIDEIHSGHKKLEKSAGPKMDDEELGEKTPDNEVQELSELQKSHLSK